LSKKGNLANESVNPDGCKDYYRSQLEATQNELKTTKRDQNDKIKQLSNSKAVIEQRVTFLEQEKEELQEKLTERANREDSIMDMIKKRCEDEQLENTKKYIESLDSKDRKIKELKDEISELTREIFEYKEKELYYKEELKNNENNNSEVTSEFTSRLKEFKQSIQTKNQRIIELENRLEQVVEEISSSKDEEIEDIKFSYQDRIDELESQLEVASQTQKPELESQSSYQREIESIKQIKESYETEKKKFQTTLKDIRRQNEEEMRAVQEEYEDKISHSKVEDIKTIESLNSQISQVVQEKQRLQSKIDDFTKESTTREKFISTLESQKESLESAVKERDEIIEGLDSELTETHNQNLEEKEAYQIQSEEVVASHAERQVEIALVKQQKEHLEEKVKELEQHLFDTKENMKNKIKDLKLKRLRDQSRDKENENRFNSGYGYNDDRLEDILNLGISVVPDFMFIKVRSILAAKPTNKNSDYDVYEIEVTDDQAESHYVIERTAYQILGLFQRLKKEFKGNRQLGGDFDFPESLKELLFDRKYSSKDVRQVTIQHYLNECCKQDLFKKSSDLTAFLEIAKYKTSIQIDRTLKEIRNSDSDCESDYLRTYE